jgi:hypothetical protein
MNKKRIFIAIADLYYELIEARRLQGLPELDNTPFPEFMNDYYQFVNWKSMYIVANEVPLLLEKLPLQKK